MSKYMELHGKQKPNPVKRFGWCVASYMPCTSLYRARKRLKREMQETYEKQMAALPAKRETSAVPSRPLSLERIGDDAITIGPTVSAAKLRNMVLEGRIRMLALMSENGVPIAMECSKPSTSLDPQAISTQLERSGIISKGGIASIKELLYEFDKPNTQKAAAMLLGAIVLDNEIYSSDVRGEALRALLSTAQHSDESRDVLRNLGISEQRIDELAEALNPRDSEPKKGLAQRLRENWRLHGAVAAAGSYGVIAYSSALNEFSLAFHALLIAITVVGGQVISYSMHKARLERDMRIRNEMLERLAEQTDIRLGNELSQIDKMHGMLREMEYAASKLHGGKHSHLQALPPLREESAAEMIGEMEDARNELADDAAYKEERPGCRVLYPQPATVSHPPGCLNSTR